MKFRIWAISVAILLLIFACSVKTTEDKEFEAVNQLHTACEDCQEADDRPGNYCLTCHYKFRSNHHPIDFTPPESELIHYDGAYFPLFDGKIQCRTCHQTDETGLSARPKLLRGGPYPDLQQLCIKCHFLNKYSRLNIHEMKYDSGQIRSYENKLVCSFCHPDHINNLYTTATIEFKADIAFLCWRCHPGMSGHFFQQHFNKIPKGDKLLRMKKFEVNNNVILPLIPWGKISCATCHNPHQKGILITATAAAGADSTDRLRVPKAELCWGCHEGGRPASR